MSLFLGKTGERIVRFRLAHKPIDNAVMKAGRAISFMTGGRYRPGLTALVYQISQQLSSRDRVTILDGRIFENGKVIAESDLLKAGKAMGDVKIRGYLATPEGIARFLRHTYLRPERWGINFDKAFSNAEKDSMHRQMLFINDKLDIRPDNGLSLSVRPLSLKYILKYSEPWLSLSLASTAIIALYGLGMIPWQEHKLDERLFLAFFSVYSYRILWKRIEKLRVLGLFTRFNRWSFGRQSTIHVRRDSIKYVFSHEYVHALMRFWFIKNDVIADSIETLIEIQETGKVACNNILEEYIKGKSTDPYMFVSENQIYFPHGDAGDDGINKFHRISRQLAGIAERLSERMSDTDAKWRFLRMVAGCTSNEELLRKLQESEFSRFFVPGAAS